MDQTLFSPIFSLLSRPNPLHTELYDIGGLKTDKPPSESDLSQKSPKLKEFCYLRAVQPVK